MTIGILCPLCRQILSQGDKVWRCEAGHSFDVAREGYVNLLPVQHKKSRAPGDGADMVAARRDFLEAGYYQPLYQAVTEMVKTVSPNSLLDIGCGEGYYTAGMAQSAKEVIGIDIAKTAVKIAAKRHKQVQWLVANGAHLPLASQSLDMICSLFSPLPGEEIKRALIPKGRLLFVTPGKSHLLSIREKLFDNVLPHQPEKFLDQLSSNFDCIERRDICFPLALQNEALRQLLLMTPYAWRAKADKRKRFESLDYIETVANFSLYVMVSL